MSSVSFIYEYLITYVVTFVSVTTVKSCSDTFLFLRLIRAAAPSAATVKCNAADFQLFQTSFLVGIFLEIDVLLFFGGGGG